MLCDNLYDINMCPVNQNSLGPNTTEKSMRDAQYKVHLNGNKVEPWTLNLESWTYGIFILWQYFDTSFKFEVVQIVVIWIRELLILFC